MVTAGYAGRGERDPRRSIRHGWVNQHARGHRARFVLFAAHVYKPDDVRKGRVNLNGTPGLPARSNYCAAPPGYNGLRLLYVARTWAGRPDLPRSAARDLVSPNEFADLLEAYHLELSEDKVGVLRVVRSRAARRNERIVRSSPELSRLKARREGLGSAEA